MIEPKLLVKLLSEVVIVFDVVDWPADVAFLNILNIAFSVASSIYEPLNEPLLNAFSKLFISSPDVRLVGR